MDFSKKIVILNFVLIILFTITCFVYQFMARDEISATLIGAFFGAISVDLASLAAIKRKKISQKGKELGEG